MSDGAVEFFACCLIALHYRHLDMLELAAHAGHKWAYQALQGDSILYYLSAAGFEEGFAAQAGAEGRRAICWSLEDVYR